MLKTSAQLKTAVAGFMQRDPAVFLRGTGDSAVDLLLQATNNARLYAERLIDFDLAKTQVDFPGMTLFDGVDLSAAVLHGTTVPAVVKKIVVPYLPLADGNWYPVDLWTKRAWSDKLKRRFDSARPTDTSDYAHLTEAPFVLIQDGTTLMVAPPDTTAFPSASFTVCADAYLWLPSYVNGTETDFLLNYCFDWMMFYCISQLNFFLKEDERVQLSEGILKDTWSAVVRWNDTLMTANTDDVDLD